MFASSKAVLSGEYDFGLVYGTLELAEVDDTTFFNAGCGFGGGGGVDHL